MGVFSSRKDAPGPSFTTGSGLSGGSGSPSASGFNCTAAPSPVEVFTLNTVPSGKFQRVFPSRKSRRNSMLPAAVCGFPSSCSSCGNSPPLAACILPIVAASRFATRISSARLIPQRNGPAGGSAVYVSFPAILFAILRT